MTHIEERIKEHEAAIEALSGIKLRIQEEFRVGGIEKTVVDRIVRKIQVAIDTHKQLKEALEDGKDSFRDLQ